MSIPITSASIFGKQYYTLGGIFWFILILFSISSESIWLFTYKPVILDLKLLLLALRKVHIDSDSTLGLYLLARFNQLLLFSCWIGSSQFKFACGQVNRGQPNNFEGIFRLCCMNDPPLRKSNALKNPLSVVVLSFGCTQLDLQSEVPTFNDVDS